MHAFDHLPAVESVIGSDTPYTLHAEDALHGLYPSQGLNTDSLNFTDAHILSALNLLACRFKDILSAH